MGGSGFESKSSHNTEIGIHPSLPVQTQFNQVTNCHKQCQPTKTVPPSGGTVSADKQKCSRTGSKPKLTRFLQPAIFGSQTQQPVETLLDLSTLNTFLNTESFKMETPETIRTSLQVGEWVTSIDFKDAYFHIQFTVSPGSTCVFTSRVSPTSSKLYPLVCPQHLWSSQWWPKRSN